jgi:hypothetical protein
MYMGPVLAYTDIYAYSTIQAPFPHKVIIKRNLKQKTFKQYSCDNNTDTVDDSEILKTKFTKSSDICLSIN